MEDVLEALTLDDREDIMLDDDMPVDIAELSVLLAEVLMSEAEADLEADSEAEVAAVEAELSSVVLATVLSDSMTN